MRIKEDGATRFEFACNDKEWSKLCDKFDINLDEEVVPEVKNGEKPKGPQVKPFELNESNSISAAIETLEKKGFSLEHYSTQEKPLFELVEGAAADGEVAAEPAGKGEKKKEDSKPKAKAK